MTIPTPKESRANAVCIVRILSADRSGATINDEESERLRNVSTALAVRLPSFLETP